MSEHDAPTQASDRLTNIHFVRFDSFGPLKA
jgi:hypothetical protein